MGPFLFFLVVAAVIFAVGFIDRDRINKTWADAARDLGLRAAAPSFMRRPRIDGTIGDVRVSVSVHSTGGDDNTNYTRYEVHHRPVGPPLRLKKQGMLSFFGRLIGRKDVVIGDPFFDDRVVIDSNDPLATQAFLTHERRAAVLELLSVHPRGEFTHDSIRIDVRSICRSRRELVGQVRQLVDIASVMGDTRLNHALEHQQHGDLVRAAQELHELNLQQDNVFTRTLEGEAMVEAGHHAEAAVLFDDLHAGAPGDAAIEGWHDLSHLPPPPAVPAAPAESSVAPPVDLRQDVVLNDLFSSDRMSWEVVEYFETTYHHATVEWTGTVTRANNYERDLDFGVGPGVKATVLIGHAGISDVISNEVHAVVQLAADAGVRAGHEVRFRGRLTNVDRFSRKVWVQHAQLV